MTPYINTLRTPLSATTHPPQSDSRQWRCPHKRLHLDHQDCVPISPDEPIVDTPSKYRKMVARKAGASLLNDSQATQPTPSAPPGRAKHNATEDSLAYDRSSRKNSPSSGGSSNRQDDAVNGNDNDDDAAFAMPSSPPNHSNHSPSSPHVVPETPLDVSVLYQSSSPLPRLTAENLLRLDAHPTNTGGLWDERPV